MANIHTTTRGCELDDADRQLLERRVERLERRLHSGEQDHVEVTLLVERQPKRQEYQGSVRVAVGGFLFPAQRNRAPAIRVLLKDAFEDIEEQIERATNTDLRTETSP